MNTTSSKLANLVLNTVNNFLPAALTVAVLLGMAATAPAATITSGGHAYDVGLGMSPYDHGGYLFFGTTPVGTMAGGSFAFNTSATGNTVAMPSFVSGISKLDLSTIAYGFNYSPIQPTAAGPVESGVAYFGGVTTGTEYPLLDINFANSGPLPSTVRIGVYVNGEPTIGNDQSPTALRLENVSNPTDTVSLAVSHSFSPSQPQGGNDLYFFNVNPTPGSTYELFGTANTNQFKQLTIAGILFTPEPGAFGMLAVGAVGLLALVRKARRRQN